MPGTSGRRGAGPLAAGGLAAAAALAASVVAPRAAAQQQQQPAKVLRIAMTAADVPTTSGMPNNGFEGMRFLGYPVFEALVGWDLSRPDQVAGLKPALAERWEQDAQDPKRWRFHLRRGVAFHDGTPFDADAVVWNLDRFFRNDAYWDAEGRAKLDRVTLTPMPEATTRLAALRSGQVDWIEGPPPDALPSLRQAGFQVTTGSYPHVWPWVFAAGRQGSPVADVRVRQALNYCFDRGEMVALLNGTAEPSVGFFKANDPNFGEPQNRYRLDAARGRALLAEAGFTPQRPLRIKAGISTSGSGQMLPLPMNELLQQQLQQHCGVRVAFEVVEWNTLLGGLRAEPTAPQWLGADALNISLVSSDASQMARWFLSANATPRGSNAGHWRDDRFDAAFAALETERDPARIAALLRTAHERLLDDPPWLWIVHDLNPRAMSRRVQGFVSPQSWFVDLARVDMR